MLGAQLCGWVGARVSPRPVMGTEGELSAAGALLAAAHRETGRPLWRVSGPQDTPQQSLTLPPAPSLRPSCWTKATSNGTQAGVQS